MTSDSLIQPHDLPAKSPMPPRNSRRIRARIIGRLLLFSLATLVAACASSPLGPPFETAGPALHGRARVYVYRSDQRGSLASVHITIDGRELGRFRNQQYMTLELAPGSHVLKAGLRGFGLLAWGWNTHQFRVREGNATYLEISVRLAAHSAPSTRELEIGGRTNGAASENVFILRQSSEQALERLAKTTRLIRD